MTPTWAQRREALVRDCIVSPDVFTSMVERLGDFVVPYQHALETENRPAQRAPLPPRAAVARRPQACRGNCGPGRCRAPGHPGLHRYCTMGSSPVDRGPG